VGFRHVVVLIFVLINSSVFTMIVLLMLLLNVELPNFLCWIYYSPCSGFYNLCTFARWVWFIISWFCRL